MTSKKLIMKIPKELSEALCRRHFGRDLSIQERYKIKKRMDVLYKDYKKIQRQFNTLWAYWERENVESFFMKPKWYNAHSRLKKLKEREYKNHREMFYTLLSADGNNEPFDRFNCLSVQEIYDDFYSKYINMPNSI